MDSVIVDSRLLYRVHLYNRVKSCLNLLKMSCLANFQGFFDLIKFCFYHIFERIGI